MDLYLPGARGIFSRMQDNRRHVNNNRITLTHGIKKTLENFRWLAKDIYSQPTRIYKLVPLILTVDSYHDASGYMYGGVVLPEPSDVTQVLQRHP